METHPLFHELSEGQLNEPWEAMPDQLKILDSLLPKKTKPLKRHEIITKMFRRPMRKLPQVIDNVLRTSGSKKDSAKCMT